MPIAVATGPAFVAAGSLVTVSGTGSIGAFPLRYDWTQRAGPPITLSSNNTQLSHSPTFTAPGVGNVVELALVVVDQLGVSSLPSVVRVGVGGAPVARFTPDGGLVAGSQLIPLTSTSFDDAGLAIVGWAWQLVSGSGGQLEVDGGLAAWRAPAVSFGSPDQLGGVSLTVTNSIGVRSNAYTQTWTVRGMNPNNWVLDAGVASPIDVGASSPTVVLRGAVSTSVTAPQYSLGWTCSPSMPLVGDNTLTAQFIAPVIVGPSVPVTCQLVATGQAPLDPPILSATVSTLLRDATDPQLVTSSVGPLRASPLGFRVIANERLSQVTAAGGCTFTVSVVVGRSALFGYRDTPADQTVCSPINATLRDRAQPINAVTLLVGSNNSTTAQTLWTGPWESTSAFDDPRPVVASLGMLPEAQQELFGAPSTVAGFELVATNAGQLVQLAGLDPTTEPTCTPTCALTSTTTLSGLPPDPRGSRVAHSGAELIVATSTDGGYVRRSPTGTWSTFAGLNGALNAWDSELRTVRLAGTDLFVDAWSTDLQTVVSTELAATGVTSLSVAASQQNRVFAAVGPTRQLLIRERNALSLTWSTRASTLTNVTAIQPIPHFGGVQFVAVEQNGSTLALQRIDPPGGDRLFPLGAVQGFDAVSFGETAFLVFGLGGDLRFQWLRYGPLAAGASFSDFAGPPRSGFSPPYPLLLDANPLCEAAWPRLAIVNEALVVTWQERCAPATQWKVMARVLR